jgi:hypothetical protein
MGFGVLTLATPNDYLKAIGLALSVRISNPDGPIAVACTPNARPLVAPYFDEVVDKDRTVTGFMHKLYLVRYSPFDETFFFDSDVLIFRPLREVLADWQGQPYTPCGHYATDGMSSFGLHRALTIKGLGAQSLVVIDGAGYAYFRKPECHQVFELARLIAPTYRAYGADIRFCDEDVINITMTKLNLRPTPGVVFFYDT